jgi:hypothetical protein
MESARKKDHNGCRLAFPLAPCDAEFEPQLGIDRRKSLPSAETITTT